MKHIFLGLTGNIGGGKTTVLNLFKDQGFVCLNADTMVHEMFIKEHRFFSTLAQAIDSEFGTEFVEMQVIDRDVLRPLLRDKKGSMEFLAQLVKPFISEEISKQRQNNQDTVIETPLLFETDVAHLFDKVVMVYCDDQERKRRIKLRNPTWSEEHIDFVMGVQMKQEDKVKLSQYVVYNDVGCDARQQVISLVESINKTHKLHKY